MYSNKRAVLAAALGAGLMMASSTTAKQEYNKAVADVLDFNKAQNGGVKCNAAALKRASRKRRNIRARASKRA